MSRIRLGVIALALSFAAAGCDEDKPKIDSKLKTFDESMKTAKAPDAGPPVKVDDGKQRVTLKWAVTREQPVTVNAKLGAGGGSKLDPAKIAQGAQLDATAIAAALSASAAGPGLTAVLAGDGPGSIAVRVRADGAPKDPKGTLGKGVAALKAEGKIRADMTGRGFITTDLDRNVRNVLALVLELPPDPVAAGDQWRSSVKLVSVSDQFNRVDSKNRNEVRLTAIEPGEDGKEIAAIDYVIAEHQEGFVGTGKERKDATASAVFVGQGRFSVQEGRWESFDGRLVTAQGGALSGGSDERVTLAVGGAAPQDLLEDPTPKPVLAEPDEDAQDAPAPAPASSRGKKRSGR